MTDSAGETSPGGAETDQRVWELALRLRDSGVIDFSGVRPTYGNILHEFEKHQDFIEADNLAHPDREPIDGTISLEERGALTLLRMSFPSDEDRAWRSSLLRI